MSNFSSAIPILLKHEGSEFTDDPNDSGGATKYGIILDDLRETNPNATVDDIKNLTETQAIKIYFTQYWQRYHLDQINDPYLSLVLLDQGVLSGMTRVIESLQTILGVEVDGIIGPATLQAIASKDAKTLGDALLSSQRNYFQEVAQKHPQDQSFLTGWLNRVASLQNILS